MELFLPPLGDAQKATIERWYKAPGDTVAAGDALLVALTERFEWDVPATGNGTIAELLAQPGETIAIGAALVRLEGTTASEASNGQVSAVATPLARRIAAAHGVDLATVAGSGRGGRVTGSDVRALLGEQTATAVVEAPAVVALPDREIERSGAVQAEPDRVLARAPAGRSADQPATISHARLVIPHALTAIEVDLSRADAYIGTHARRMARRGIVLDYTATVAAAVVRSLAAHRPLNSTFGDDGLILRSRIDLRVVRDDGRATVIPNAADLNVQGLARAIGTGEQGIKPDPTFTLVAGGSRWEHALIDGSQSAALTVGAVERRPVVIEQDGRDEIAIRLVAVLTLAYDARAIMPHEADAFLQVVKEHLEHVAPV
jgi:pyruvate dehydrogenase E2 component (dihydrolipoamide acetyltransferase)